MTENVSIGGGGRGMSAKQKSDEVVAKLQAFLKENGIQLRLSPIKVKMVDDGSAIIEPSVIIVTPVEEVAKVN
jgi:Iap family predicted aminopeptidase